MKGLIGKLKTGSSDNFQTPYYPIKALLDILPHMREGVAFDPCAGRGSILGFLNVEGVSCCGTDLTLGNDFLDREQKLPAFDRIITNPPYSKKTEFLKRAYELKKPFAMLMPLTALEGKRQDMFKEFGLTLLLLRRRVNFLPPSGKGSGAHFATAWFIGNDKMLSNSEILYE